MRKIIAAIAGCLVCATAFAEAPELRQKLPTEWWHIERIREGKAGSLEMARIGWGDKLYGWLKESRYGSYIKNLNSEDLLSCTVFYKESVGADEFYWQSGNRISFPAADGRRHRLVLQEGRAFRLFWGMSVRLLCDCRRRTYGGHGTPIQGGHFSNNQRE